MTMTSESDYSLEQIDQQLRWLAAVVHRVPKRRSELRLYLKRMTDIRPMDRWDQWDERYSLAADPLHPVDFFTIHEYGAALEEWFGRGGRMPSSWVQPASFELTAKGVSELKMWSSRLAQNNFFGFSLLKSLYFMSRTQSLPLPPKNEKEFPGDFFCNLLKFGMLHSHYRRRLEVIVFGLFSGGWHLDMKSSAMSTPTVRSSIRGWEEDIPSRTIEAFEWVAQLEKKYLGSDVGSLPVKNMKRM